jgi:23S rRNA (guanosine2251-2'-O)-methyltransferase
VWVSGSAAQEEWPANVEVIETTAEKIDELSRTDTNQGVAAEVEEFLYSDAAELLAQENAFVLVLDEIKDPHNLGAICRVAEAAGVTGVVIPRHRAAEVTGAVCRASAGAVEHLKVAQVRNIADFLTDAGQAGLWRYGAAGEASQRWDAVDWTGPVVLVMGSEGKGLRPRVAKACDLLVALPLNGQVDSLNVATATAAIVYEAVRQRAS